MPLDVTLLNQEGSLIISLTMPLDVKSKTMLIMPLNVTLLNHEGSLKSEKMLIMPLNITLLNYEASLIIFTDTIPCKVRKNSSFLKLFLIMPLDVTFLN